MHRPERIGGALLLAALLALAQGRSAAASPQSWVSDAWITARAKIALLTTRDLGGTGLSVDTVEGHVSLSGEVRSTKEKKLAEDVVRPIEGVQNVRNLLRVVASAATPPAPPPDDRVRADVSAALAKDRELAGTQITVVSVKNGLVALAGTARSSRELLRAIEITQRVNGVRHVQSTVATVKADASLEIWNRHELRQDGPGVLDAAADLWTTTQTRLALIADSRVPGLDVSVDCRDGRVTLFGAVATKEAKQAAGEDAASVAGADHVKNDVQVVPESKRAVVAARDDAIARAVTDAIYERPEMKRASIAVDVKNGVVRLSGSVPSEQHRLFAATAARGVAGVRSVEQDVTVTRITEDPATPAKPAA